MQCPVDFTCIEETNMCFQTVLFSLKRIPVPDSPDVNEIGPLERSQHFKYSTYSACIFVKADQLNGLTPNPFNIKYNVAGPLNRFGVWMTAE